jgi:hypothetical protein
MANNNEGWALHKNVPNYKKWDEFDSPTLHNSAKTAIITVKFTQAQTKTRPITERQKKTKNNEITLDKVHRP